MSTNATTDWQTYRKNRNLAILAEAGGNIERAISLMYMDNEHFDGEIVIGLSAEVRFREDCGFPTADAKRRLIKAQADEDREWAAYERKAGR